MGFLGSTKTMICPNQFISTLTGPSDAVRLKGHKSFPHYFALFEIGREVRWVGHMSVTHPSLAVDTSFAYL